MSALKKPFVWAFTTYFTEGFPYSLIRTLSSVFFRDKGMSLEAIGVTSVFGLPWVLKFLWGPLLDSFGTKRTWLLYTQAILCVLFLLISVLAPLPNILELIVVVFFLSSFVAATHDIAIDGYYMEALDKEGQAKYVGYRVMAYRIAMMTGTGVIATVGTIYSWFYGFLLGSAIMIGLYLFHLYTLDEYGKKGAPITLPSLQFVKRHGLKFFLASLCIIAVRNFCNSDLFLSLKSAYPVLKKFSFPTIIGLVLFLALITLWFYRNKLRAKLMNNPESFYGKSFLSFIDRERIGAILAFIIFIRTGEYMLSAMYSPWIVDLGLKHYYGTMSAGIGLPFSIIGAMAGGWLISRFSLKKMIWPFLFLQNFTNLIYMVLALNLEHYIAVNTGNPAPVALSSIELLGVVVTLAFDQFSGGLGTAVLMTFLMRISRKDFKASHYAIGTGLMSVSGLYAGVVSGFLTSWIGYGYFFGISFLMSIPGMLLIFWVPLEKSLQTKVT